MFEDRRIRMCWYTAKCQFVSLGRTLKTTQSCGIADTYILHSSCLGNVELQHLRTLLEMVSFSDVSNNTVRVYNRVPRGTATLPIQCLGRVAISFGCPAVHCVSILCIAFPFFALRREPSCVGLCERERTIVPTLEQTLCRFAFFCLDFIMLHGLRK